MAHLVLLGVPPASLDLSREGETWREVPGDSTDPAISCVCLFLSALALVRLREGGEEEVMV